MAKCSICKTSSKYTVDTEYYKHFEHHFKEGLKTKYLASLNGHICTKCLVEFWGIKKLYHISKYSDPLIEKFEFRIPGARANDEDSKTDRICLSDNIESALSSVPWGGDLIYDFDGNIRLYEFDINSFDLKKLITPEYLYQNALVPDAGYFREFWAIRGKSNFLKPDEVYKVELKSFETDSVADISYLDYLKAIQDDEDPEKYSKGFIREIWDVNFLLEKES